MPDKNLQMTELQERFVALFPLLHYNISTTCEEVGIARQTYYDWMQVPYFREAIEARQEEILDMAEQQLKLNIQEGKTQELLFLLKTKGKKRGYGETVDITSAGEKISINIIFPKDEENTEE